jgi:hypothetical protein
VLPAEVEAPPAPAEVAKPKRSKAKAEPKAAEPPAPLLFDLAAPLPDAPGRGG